MLSLILKDRGSQFHSKITDDDFRAAKKELSEITEDKNNSKDLMNGVFDFIESFAKDFEWFDSNALKNANKENLTKFVWLVGRPYELKMKKDGHAKYNEENDLSPTKKESKKFDKYFRNRDKIGTRFFWAWGADWTIIFSSGFQLARLILGPFMFIAGKIPYVALAAFVLWVFAAFFDWVVLAIPYFVLWLSSGLPSGYYNSDLLIGSYLMGDSMDARNEIRELVKNDKANSDAYEAALWALFMREKMIEIIRKSRNEM